MNRKIITQILLFTTIIFVLSGCDDSSSSISTKPTPQTTAENITVSKARALPFQIETVMSSDLFKNNLKVARINVSVEGGTKEEWAATSIAIAERVAGYGIDSVEVSVNRNDII